MLLTLNDAQVQICNEALTHLISLFDVITQKHCKDLSQAELKSINFAKSLLSKVNCNTPQISIDEIDILNLALLKYKQLLLQSYSPNNDTHKDTRKGINSMLRLLQNFAQRNNLYIKSTLDDYV